MLIAGFIVAAAAAGAVGWRATFFWLGSLSATNAAILTAFLTLLLLLLSFILRSLRRPILSVWSGAGCPSWMRNRQQRRRDKFQGEIDAPLVWQNVDATVDTIVHETRPDAVPPAIHRGLMRAVSKLSKRRHSSRPSRLRNRFDNLCTQVAAAYRQYDGESLIPLRARIDAFAEERKNNEAFERDDLRSRLFLEYGQAGVLEGTRLGNILAALDDYPFTRYQMEGSVFWPHLEQMITGDLLDEIRNQRILLDFELALATILLVLAILAPIAEARIALAPFLTVLLPAVVTLAVLARFLYLAALPTAGALSSALRAGCDLHRQDLLWALGVYAPRNLDAERATWERLSRLVIYGAVQGGVQFRPRPPQPPLGRDP